MQEMLNSASRCTHSRKLNTIMETVEYPEENGNFSVDAAPEGDMNVKETSATSRMHPRDKPLKYRTTDILQTAIYGNPSEKRLAFTHASPRHTLSTAPSYWRKKASVSITPAGIIRSSSEPSPFRPSCSKNNSEVELFFPEFFKDGEIPRCGQNWDAVYNYKKLEQEKSTQGDEISNEDPLVQSWLSLFGSPVCG